MSYTWNADEIPQDLIRAEFCLQKRVIGTTYGTDRVLRCISYNLKQDYGEVDGSKSYDQEAIERTINNAVGDIDTKINNAVEGNKVIIKVSPIVGDSGYQFTGKNAVQQAIDSITDASVTKRYEIRAKAGLYKITNCSEYLGYPGYPAMICMKDYVDVVGDGPDKTIFWAELPVDESEWDEPIAGSNLGREKYQTVWNWANEATIKDCTLVAKNIRYVVHQDSGLTAGGVRYYENVNLYFYGTLGYMRCFGLGTWNGEATYVRGGREISDAIEPFSVHNNSKFSLATKWSLKYHQFICHKDKVFVQLNNLGSLLNDEFELVGCSWGGACYILNYNYGGKWLKGNPSGGFDNFDHAEWRITGGNNAPFYFKNAELNLGTSIKITSKSTGNNSAVTINTACDCYGIFVKNPRTNTFSVHLPYEDVLNGYIVREGSLGLSAYAITCVDIYEGVYAYEEENYTSLAKRLGDCSVNNKTLIINIDGTDYTIVFNKDYSSMSNANILAEITDVIGNVAIVEQVHYGQSYYPELPDVMGLYYNSSVEQPILKGTVVTLDDSGFSRIKPCGAGDAILGVALDDIPVYEDLSASAGKVKGCGRVLTRGFISTDNSLPFFAKCDTVPDMSKKLSVSNGKFVEDANGTIRMRDNGIVRINC